MVDIPDFLVDRLKAREAALVTGFGCGELAGAPGWAALVDGLSARLPFSDERERVARLVNAGRLTDAVGLVRDLVAHGVLRDALREAFPDGRQPPEAVRQAAALPWRAIVTTGFDDLWPQATAAAHPEREPPGVVVGTDATAHLRSFGRRALIMQLFGRADRPESLCFGPGDARARLPLAGGLPWLGELYRRRSLVLVGFGPRDPDLLWLTAWMSVAPPSGTQHFIFLDTSTETDPETEARLLALRTGMTVIPCSTGAAEALARLGALVQDLGPDLPPLDDDIDVDAWLNRWAQAPAAPEPRAMLARAAAALHADERWDQLADLLVRRAPLQEDPADQLADLRQAAAVFRDHLGAAAPALQAEIGALRLAPADDELWEAIIEDADAADAWPELVEGASEVALAAGATPDAARIWRRIARVIRHQPGGDEDALASYRHALTAEPGHLETRDEQLELLRALSRWSTLVGALHAGAAEAQDPTRASILIREAAELLEHRLHDPAGAIAALEQVLLLERQRPDGGGADTGDSDASPTATLERLYEAEGRFTDLVALLDERARRAEPGAAAAIHLRRADLRASRLGDLEGAASELEELVAAHPANRDALARLERIYRDGERHLDYVATLRRQADLIEDDPTGRLTLLACVAAEGEATAGGGEHAVRALEEILRIAPLDPEAFPTLLRLHRSAGAFTAMTDVVHRRLAVVTSADERAALHAMLGKIHERDLGDPERAFDAYAAAEAEGDRRDEIYETLVRLAEGLGRWRVCAALLQRWAEATSSASGSGSGSAPHVEAALRMQAALLFLGVLDDGASAEAELTRVLELTPDHPRAAAALARLARERGDFARAAPLFMDAAARESDPREKARLLDECGQLAADHLKQDDLAADLFRRALAADPDHAGAADRLADIHTVARDWAELEPLLDGLVARAVAAGDVPKCVALHLRRAEVALALDHPDRALACFVEAERLAPDDVAVLEQFAGFQTQQAHWREAADLLDRLLVHHRSELSPPRILEIILHIAECRGSQGDVVAALHRYEEARALAPDRHATLRALGALHATKLDWPAWIANQHRQLGLVAPDERAALLEELGDAYHQHLADDAEAIAAYRAAWDAGLPRRRSALRKIVDLEVAAGRWQAAADALNTLAESETDPALLAQTLHTAAVIERDQLHQPAEAVARLESALDHAPDQLELFDALDELHRRAGAWSELADSLRRMINRLPPTEATAERRARLWSQLGSIALGRLRDRALATEAFEQAAALEPANLVHRQALGDLYLQAGPDARDKAIAAHQRLITEDPNQLGSYQALATLYADLGPAATDRRFCVAAALSFMRKADATEEALFERLRPRKVRIAARPFSVETWRRVTHPDEHRLVDALFAMCGAYAAAPAALGAGVTDRPGWSHVDQESDPRPLVRALAQIAETLNVATPDLFLHDEREGRSTILNVRSTGGAPRPTLVLAPATYGREDPFELAFEAAKLMSFVRPERFLRYALGKADAIEVALRAIVRLVSADALAPGEPDVEAAVDDLAERLKRSIPRGVVAQAESLLADHAGRGWACPDARQWLAATELTAARTALLVAGDLGAAARVLWTEPAAVAADGQPDAVTISSKERLKDLLAFSVSDDYFACRQQLGLAVA